MMMMMIVLIIIKVVVVEVVLMWELEVSLLKYFEFNFWFFIGIKLITINNLANFALIIFMLSIICHPFLFSF
jgi:hypothetical protein